MATRSIQTQNKDTQTINPQNPTASPLVPPTPTPLPATNAQGQALIGGNGVNLDAQKAQQNLFDGRPTDREGRPLPYGTPPGGYIVKGIYYTDPVIGKIAYDAANGVKISAEDHDKLYAYNTSSAYLDAKQTIPLSPALYADLSKAPPAVQHAAALDPSSHVGQKFYDYINQVDPAADKNPQALKDPSLTQGGSSAAASASPLSAAPAVAAAQASINQAATNIQNTTPDLTKANDLYNQQQAAINQIQGMANGTGPNPAAIALAQAQQSGLASLASAGATASSGSSPGLAGRGIAAQQGALQAQLGAQGALSMANQQQQAIYNLASVTNTAQSNQYNQALGLAGYNVGTQAQAAGLFGASAQLGQNQQQLDQNYELTLASLNQDYAKFTESMAYQQQQASQAQSNSLWGGILSGAGAVLGGVAGFALSGGNPLGAAVGAGVGSSVGSNTGGSIVSPAISSLSSLASGSSGGTRGQTQLSQPSFGASYGTAAATGGTGGGGSGNYQLSYTPVY